MRALDALSDSVLSTLDIAAKYGQVGLVLVLLSAYWTSPP